MLWRKEQDIFFFSPVLGSEMSGLPPLKKMEVNLESMGERKGAEGDDVLLDSTTESELLNEEGMSLEGQEDDDDLFTGTS